MNLAFTILGVPVAKGRPRLTARGGFARAYTPAKTRHAEETLAARAMQYRPAQPCADPVDVTVLFVFPYPASMSKKKRVGARHVVKPDLDNCLKLFADAMNGVFWIDDKQIVSLQAAKTYGAVPCTKVRIVSNPMILTDADVPF